jgi:hypothetical protein
LLLSLPPLRKHGPPRPAVAHPGSSKFPRAAACSPPVCRRTPPPTSSAQAAAKAPRTSPATSHVISSSETLGSAPARKPGNTGVKRKNLSAHHVIVEAVKNSGALLAHEMKAMAEANHELERGKIDVQLKLFAE